MKNSPAPRTTGSRRGMMLAVVLLLGVMLVGLTSGLVLMARQQTQTQLRYETYKDEFAACEAALNKAFGQIKFLKDYHAANFEQEIATMTPPVVSGYEFTKFTVVKTFDGPQPFKGSLSGYSGRCICFQVDVTARKLGEAAERFEHDGVSLRQEITLTYVPPYIFAIFYNQLMEIAPGAKMVINGLVHTNSDAYVQSNSGLDFLAPVTVAGSMYHGRAPGSGQTGSDGDVRFSNDNDQLLSMKRGDNDGWLTHGDIDWGTAVPTRWGDGLADSAQNAEIMDLPLPVTADPHAIIDRASSGDSQALTDEKLENKAGLKILVGSNGTIKGYNASGVEVPLTFKVGNKTENVASLGSFYDAREGKMVNALNVDIGKLIASGRSPSNGLVYIANEQGGNKFNAARLVNGATLPSSTAGGFSVASPNPVYVKGDYNTINKKLAMIAADALTLLSNNWDDARSNGSLSSRDATRTTVNAVCMQGIVATSGNNYSGGVENYFRLLEDWGGVDLNFSGSIINMWNSERALGRWKQTGNYYNAPNRNWSWDNALGGMAGPPGIPPVIMMNRTAWEMPEG